MADEVGWTRILVLRLGSSVYAFSLMLALYLAGLVGGSLTGAALRLGDLRRGIASAQLLLAATILAQVFAFPLYTPALVGLGTRIFHVGSFAGLFAAEAATTAAYLLPPTFLMGLTFALVLRAASRDTGIAPVAAGHVYSANTLGGITGALLAGFLAIPVRGSQPTLLATGLLATLVALGLARSAWQALLAPAAFLALAFLPPRDSVILSAGIFSDVAPRDVVFYAEDVTGTIAVMRHHGLQGAALSLELNGVNVAGTTPDLVVVQKLQAHLPLSLAARTDVFPNVSVWYPHSVENSFTIVLATPQPRIRLSELRDRVARPAVRDDLAKIGAADPAELLSYLMLAPADVRRWVADDSPHVDDRPSVEYESGRTLQHTGTWSRTFSTLVSRRSRIEDFVDGLVSGDPLSERVLARFSSSGATLERHLREVQELARKEP